MNGRLLIAAGVVFSALALLGAAYVANAVSVIKSGGVYVVPKELIDLCGKLLIPSVTILYVGSAIEARKAKAKKKDD